MESVHIQTTGPLMQSISTQTPDLVSASNYETAHQDPLSEVVGKQYRMAHHNITHWAIIREKLQPIAEGEATFEDIIGTISFFVNDDQFKSRYIITRQMENPQPTPPQPMKFMLDEFFKTLTPQEKIFYQTDLLPNIAKLILETEELFPLDKKISILTQHENETITLSKRQCACLIAHMFFCIIVDQAVDFKLSKLIDFSVICEKPGLAKFRAMKIHKLRCLFTYFEKVFHEREKLNGNVVFERLYLAESHTEETHWMKRPEETWMRCAEPMTKAQILSEGGVEDKRDALQVVFSDKELGDQVLELPATQQQIMSLIHPELLLSLLFCERLESTEAIRVFGAGRYSNYKGYSDTFEFTGSYTEGKDTSERQHVIMDAEKYDVKQARSQFAQTWVLRELNKAYSGFFLQDEEERRVATGRWGCGVFKGNPQLKFIIQWLAASRTGRDLEFYCYGDTTGFIAEETQKILNHYIGMEVRELFEDLDRAAMEMQTENMETNSIITEVLRTERKKDDEDKNLFKVLIALNGL